MKSEPKFVDELISSVASNIFCIEGFPYAKFTIYNTRMLYLVAFVVKILVSTCIKQQRLWGIKSAIRFSRRF